jgi:hypothetical protein
VDQSYAAHDRWQAAQQPAGPAGGHDPNAGGVGDDADYSWFEYLGQGQSARPMPGSAPAPQAFTPDLSEPQPRRGRRGRGDDQGFAPPPDRGESGPVPAGRDDPGLSRPGRGSRHARHGHADESLPGPAGFVPPDRGAPRGRRTGRAGSRHARREQADPDPSLPGGFDPAAFAGPGQTGFADTGPATTAFADPRPAMTGFTDPGQATAGAADPYAHAGYGFDARQPGVTDPGFGAPEFAEPGYAEPGYAPPPAPARPRHGRHGRGSDAAFGLAEPADPGFAPPGPAGPGFGPPGPADQEFAPPGLADPGLDRLAAADAGASAGPGRRRPAPGRGGNRAAGRRGRPPAEVPAGPRQAPESGEFPRLESSAGFPSLEALDRAEPVREAPARPPRRRPGRPAPGRRSAEAADAVSGTRQARVRPAARERTPREARRARKRVSNRALIAVAAVAVMGGAAFVLLTGHNHGVPHVVTAPNALGSYVKQPQLAIQMQAKQLQHDIVTQSAGEARNVVYAVYEDSAGSGAKTAPQIVLFIGGNLSGTSAGSFVSSFSGKLPGAATTGAGPMGGNAACVPSQNGRLAECAWADNDTFGVVASPTLNATKLAAEMRQLRPMVERRTGSGQV